MKKTQKELSRKQKGSRNREKARLNTWLVKGLARSQLGTSVHDAGRASFLAMLEYKAQRYGRAFVKVGRFEPTSQVCSVCGIKDGPNLCTYGSGPARAKKQEATESGPAERAAPAARDHLRARAQGGGSAAGRGAAMSGRRGCRVCSRGARRVPSVERMSNPYKNVHPYMVECAAEAARVAGGVTAARLADPGPTHCPDWDLRTLVNHWFSTPRTAWNTVRCASSSPRS